MEEIMLKNQIRKVRGRSDKDKVGKVAANVISRDCMAPGSIDTWTTDTTHINRGSEKIYLSAIRDMSRGEEMISYNISRSPNMEKIKDVLDEIFVRFDDLNGLLLHSDKGWQYQHDGYCKRLEDHGIIQSVA